MKENRHIQQNCKIHKNNGNNKQHIETIIQRHTQLCLYISLARPVLCYGSEAWTTRKQDTNRITACEMKLMWGTAGYTKWDE